MYLEYRSDVGYHARDPLLRCNGASGGYGGGNERQFFNVAYKRVASQTARKRRAFTYRRDIKRIG